MKAKYVLPTANHMSQIIAPFHSGGGGGGGDMFNVKQVIGSLLIEHLNI